MASMNAYGTTGSGGGEGSANYNYRILIPLRKLTSTTD